MFAIQRTVSEGLIPVTTEYDQITNFRTAMYHEGNPCGFDGVQPNFVMFAESLGNGVNHGEPEPEPDPIHEELQHSLRRHLARRPHDGPAEGARALRDAGGAAGRRGAQTA